MTQQRYELIGEEWWPWLSPAIRGLDADLKAVEAASGGTAVATASPGDDLQAELNELGVGGTLILEDGTYPLSAPLVPLDMQRIAASGARLYGGITPSGWTSSGSVWSATDSRIETTSRVNNEAQCDINDTSRECSRPEQMWVDGVRVPRVATAGEVSGNTWHLDNSTKTITIGFDPSGKTIEVSRYEYAVRSSAFGVTLEGLEVDCFATSSQMGAVNPEGDGSLANMRAGSGWVIRGCEVHRVHGVGVKLAASHGTEVCDCFVHDNGQLGISVWKSKDVTVTKNRTERNNTDGHYTHDWEAGGIKVTAGSTGRFSGNTSRDDEGIGIWFDGWEGGWDTGLVCTENAVINSASCGIRCEIARNVTISQNTVVGCGFRIARPADVSLWATSGINVLSVNNVRVFGNRLVGNRHGMGIQYRVRSDAPAMGRVDVVGNDIDLASQPNSTVGVVVSDPSLVALFQENVKFEANRYRFASTGALQGYQMGLGGTEGRMSLAALIDATGEVAALDLTPGATQPDQSPGVSMDALFTVTGQSVADAGSKVGWGSGTQQITSTPSATWQLIDGNKMRVPAGFAGTYTITYVITRPAGSPVAAAGIGKYDSTWATHEWLGISSPAVTAGPGGEVVSTFTGTATFADGDILEPDVHANGTGSPIVTDFSIRYVRS